MSQAPLDNSGYNQMWCHHPLSKSMIAAISKHVHTCGNFCIECVIHHKCYYSNLYTNSSHLMDIIVLYYFPLLCLYIYIYIYTSEN